MMTACKRYDDRIWECDNRIWDYDDHAWEYNDHSNQTKGCVF